ncbi:MAG: symmetrical bis(5'-nucleosyl)-tetraphosphatase [Gammaproteobacteria bacterium]
MRIFAIGDVQGCAQPLEELLRHIRFDPAEDRLWFVGDLVNRGPDSLSVLRRVKSLGDAAVCVLGNHDLHLLALAFGNRQKDKSNPGLQAVLDAPDGPELIHWLRHLPMIHHDEKIGFTMVHAGLPPKWSLKQALECGQELEAVLRGKKHEKFFADMYGNQPDDWSKSLSGMDRWRYITNCLTRMRFLHKDGSLELKHKGQPNSAPKGLVPWFEHPKRKTADTRIVCGHWSTLGYSAKNNVYATDTGCLWGGSLTALQIHPKIERFSLECEAIRTP